MATGEAFSVVMILVVYGTSAFVLWKFYRALARIGEELAEINMVLRDRHNRPGGETQPGNTTVPAE